LDAAFGGKKTALRLDNKSERRAEKRAAIKRNMKRDGETSNANGGGLAFDGKILASTRRVIAD
jgi:hypothetical protein